MNELPLLLIILGTVIVIMGLLWHFGSKYLPLGKLPGDITFGSGNFKLYFPLATSIIISLLLTFLFWIFQRIRK